MVLLRLIKNITLQFAKFCIKKINLVHKYMLTKLEGLFKNKNITTAGVMNVLDRFFKKIFKFFLKFVP